MDVRFLETVRLSELEAVLATLREKTLVEKQLLEIGAGAGWQAQSLAENGYTVEAIDIESNTYAHHKVWPVLSYDGRHMPFRESAFDVVFSSNVLDKRQPVARVSRRDTTSPEAGWTRDSPCSSTSWRLWTNVAHYPVIAGIIARAIYRRCTRMTDQGNPTANEKNDPSATRSRIPRQNRLKMAIVPEPNGAEGNAFTELYRFSRSRWTRAFESTGWTVIETSSNRLFYSGYALFGFALPIRARRYLSYVLGGSCHLFVLKRRR